MVARDSNFTNAYQSELTADSTGTDLSWQVASTAGLTSPCYLVFDPANAHGRREYIWLDGSFSSTSISTTALANRYLSGSAASSGIAHPTGEVVRFAPTKQHFDDLHDRIDEHAAAAAPHSGHALWLASAVVTSEQAGITTAVDITGLSLTVTLSAATRLRITHYCGNVRGTTAGDVANVKLLRDGTQYANRQVPINNTGRNGGGTLVLYQSLSAGTYTFKVQLERSAGTGSVSHYASSTEHAVLIVEAIGGS